MRWRAWITGVWYGHNPLAILLSPLSWIYRGVVSMRRLAYAKGILPVARFPVPVIVVGNLTVGGTGKTPLVIALCRLLRSRNYRPGVISRGYGGRSAYWPRQVHPDSDPYEVGDEPVILARRIDCPVVVGPHRVAAARFLLQNAACDLVLSDDGLQHLGLGRDLEICVIDGLRRFGNGRCLPAGPLREPLQRLQSVDMCLVNGTAGPGEYAMKIEASAAVSMSHPGNRRSLSSFAGETVHAVAGIGNPERFFTLLQAHRIRVIGHVYPDHHRYANGEFEFGDAQRVLMTEKDAVKYAHCRDPKYWYVPIEAVLPSQLEQVLIAKLKGKRSG
ncbi:MAG: tetraacyldisaccharide 4'-kinase [Gammaproteobacteria bacterium]